MNTLRALPSILGRTASVVAVVAIATAALAFGLNGAGASQTVVFVVSAVALAALATLIGQGTDQLGQRLGPATTGILQSALGNLPELFISIFALQAGLVVVVQTALIGSILANSLLVLGLAFLIGGLRHGTQTFHAPAVRTLATLLLLAVAALAIPTLATMPGEPDAGHERDLSVIVSIVLLVVFVASIPFSLKGGRGASVELHEPSDEPAWPLALALGVLAIGALGAALTSELFVDALKPTMASLGLSEAFVGLVDRGHRGQRGREHRRCPGGRREQDRPRDQPDPQQQPPGRDRAHAGARHPLARPRHRGIDARADAAPRRGGRSSPCCWLRSSCSTARAPGSRGWPCSACT